MTRRPTRWMRGAMASWALALAGAVAAWAASPVGKAWTADPEEQFLLDVNIRQLRLGDGVRAYQTPEGTCVVFGDFLTTLDVPMKIDLQAKKASGWAFREENKIEIDVGSGTARFAGQQERLAEGVVRETPEGWCVDSAALARWFKLGVKPMTSGSLLILESEAKLPVELAIEREKRASRIKPAALPLEGLPKVKLPYRMWRAPALDFIVNAGVTYQASTGMRVDRSASVAAAGEIAHLSYDAMLTTDNKGRPQSLRVHGYRSDPDGGLLGPLNATHFGFGDVQGLQSRLVEGSSGRGVEVTNRPLVNPLAFDRTRFEGDLPAGWDAELYRNGELLAFSRSNGSQRYVFEDVPLLYGDNRIEIITYGPQGQTRSRLEYLNVAQQQVPAGQTWYWAGVNQPGKNLLGKFIDRDDGGTIDDLNPYRRPDLQAAVQVEHGLDKRTSIGVLAAILLEDREKLTFIEGSVRRSIGPAIVEAAVARDFSGGVAARAQAIAKVGTISVSAEALLANDFVIKGRREEKYRDARLSVDAPVELGRQDFAAHADVRLIDRGNNDRTLNAASRLSTNFNGFNLTTYASWQRRLTKDPARPPDLIEAGLIGTGHIKNVRLRGEAVWEFSPESRFRSAELSAYWSASDRVDWEGAVGYDAYAKRGRARISHIRRFSTLAAAASLEAGTDGSIAAGINLNFSLDSGRGGFRLTNQRLATTGTVDAQVYRDLNDNGVRDLAEPLEKGALITTGTKVSEEATDKFGRVRVGGLQPYKAIAVGIDTSTLEDPSLTPKQALQVVVPRPGVAARVEIGLVGAGDIEGVLVKNDGEGFEGLDIELVDATGKTVATTRSDFDGFFLFERVAYGRYSFRLTGDSARAVGVDPAIDKTAEISAQRTVVRLGPIRLAKLPQIALSQAGTGAAASPH
ncbi:MAG TPA: carboxypeptidase-like regulatory domain-containing protein [Sphingomicrobium sp.]|nr:carboxypeptidase-like regulatory domain-containing protein [Sphingomicrobium sp.]